MRVCEGLNSDTTVCTHKAAAVQLDLRPFQLLGKHLGGSMSNTSYCIVRLGFMTAIFAVGERRTV